MPRQFTLADAAFRLVDGRSSSTRRRRRNPALFAGGLFRVNVDNCGKCENGGHPLREVMSVLAEPSP